MICHVVCFQALFLSKTFVKQLHLSTPCSSAIGFENGEEYFVDFELDDGITVDESDLWSYTNYESTELVISDIMTYEEIFLINKSEESPALESIPTSEAGEVGRNSYCRRVDD